MSQDQSREEASCERQPLGSSWNIESFWVLHHFSVIRCIASRGARRIIKKDKVKYEKLTLSQSPHIAGALWGPLYSPADCF